MGHLRIKRGVESENVYGRSGFESPVEDFELQLGAFF